MKELSPKELEIFRAVNRLLDAGENPYTIKASDIAREAGIAKGSIYTYFQTKEEAVGKAIIWRMRKSIEDAMRRSAGQTGFRGQFYACLDYVEEIAGNSNSLFHLVAFGVKSTELLAHVKRGMEEFCQNRQEIERFVMEMAEEGIREGILHDRQPDFAYAVISSAILGFFHLLCKRQLTQPEIDTAKEYAYRMTVKALQ